MVEEELEEEVELEREEDWEEWEEEVTVLRFEGGRVVGLGGEGGRRECKLSEVVWRFGSEIEPRRVVLGVAEGREGMASPPPPVPS